MNTGDLSFFATGLWCIPLVFLGALLGLALLVRYWRLQSLQDLKHIQAELRGSEKQTRALAAALQGYSPTDPEPYGSQAANLENKLQDFQRQAHNLRIEYVGMQEEAHRLISAPWHTLPRAPYEWYHLRREIAALHQRLETPRALLASLEQSQQGLQRQAWQTAQSCRQVRGLHLAVSQAIERLRAQNVHGSALDAAVDQAERARQDLKGLPDYFLTGEEGEVLAQADRDTVIAAYRIVSDHGPGLEQLNAQTQEWEKGHAQVVEQVSTLRHSLASLEQGLATAPPTLVLDEWSRQFQNFMVISQALHASLGRPEVESIPLVSEQAARTQQAVDDVGGRLRQARQQHAALEQLLPELLENLKAVSAQFTALGTSPIHPVVWDQSSPKLTRLSQQVNAIGSLRKPRTPEQVEKDLNNATQLNTECKELGQYCQQVARQHAQLLDLLASPEISQGVDWFTDVEKLLSQVQQYHPENWPRGDMVASLPGELASLKDGLENLAGAAAARPIPEAQVALSLEDVRYLKENQRSLRMRLSNIQNHLGEIQLIEGHAAEQLQRAGVTLTLLESLSRSNRYLLGIAAREVQNQQFSLEALRDELEHSERGTVDKKSRQVKAFVEGFEQQANRWLEQLNQDIRGKTDQLNASLKTLEAVAKLDESAVAAADRLVSADRGQKSFLGLDELGLEFKQRCEFWEKCDAAQKALAEVEKPVLETSQQVSQNHQTVQKQLADAADMLRQPTGWLPVGLSLGPERREFDSLGKQWQNLQEKSTTAIQLVADLGKLSSRYQVLSEKIGRAMERAAEEQAELESLDSELSEHRERWKNLRRAYRDNPQASQEINDLLDGVEKEVESLRKQARQGDLSAEQLEQALKKLTRRVRLAQVAVDDQHAVDVNGRVIPFRESTYREF